MKTRMILAILLVVLGLACGASAEMVAYYGFEGNASDSLGNNDGTVFGNPTYVTGKYGQAIDLDGVEDYVDCGNSAVFNMTDEITVAAWVCIDTIPAQWTAVVTKGNSAWRLSTLSNTRKFVFAVTATNNIPGATEIPVGEWHHLCGTYNGTNIRLYLDGIEDPQSPTAYSGNIATNSDNVYIGSNADTAANFWDGLMDDVRIYTHALDSDQVMRLVTNAMGTAFTYEGRLLDGGSPADRVEGYDFQFKLYEDPAGGSQIGPNVYKSSIDVIEGYFTVELDFGSDAFDGTVRWLEIGVRPGEFDDPDEYTILEPRIEITPTPYSLFASNGGGGGNSLEAADGDPTYAVYVDDEGKVGIGTTTPSAKFEVNGDSRTNAIDLQNNWGHVAINAHWDGLKWILHDDGFGSLIQQNGDRGGLTLSVADSGSTGSPINWNHAVRVTKDGKVGIGTNDPEQKLHIKNGNITFEDSTNPNNEKLLRFMITGTGQNSKGYKFSWRNDDGSFRTSAIEMDRTGDVYFPSGKVGIGTQVPQAELEVNGQVKITGGSPGAGKVLTSTDSTGLATWQVPSSGADNLGNHIATQNIALNGNWLSGDGENQGIYVTNGGSVGIGTSVVSEKMCVEGNVKVAGKLSASCSEWSGPAIKGTNYNRDEGPWISPDIPSCGGYFYAPYVGMGVLGIGSGCGGSFTALRDTGVGVKGEVTEGGRAVYGTAYAPDPDPDGYGSIPHYGGYFLATGKGGVGGYFEVTGKYGTGIHVKGGPNGLAAKFEGKIRTEVLEITGADVAEKFPVSEEVKPGMLAAVDPDNPGKLCLARGAYNRCVAGVVSGAGGLPTGAVLGNLPGQEDAMPVALSGRVWVYCDANEQAIEPGNLLTTSKRPGYAMTVTNFEKAHGAIIGKAMTRLEKGKMGLVLVTLQ